MIPSHSSLWFQVVLMLGLLAPLAQGQESKPIEPQRPPERPATPERPRVDPIADQLLKECCDYLAKAPELSVNTEVWIDEVIANRHKVSITRTVDAYLRRPNRLQVEVRSPTINRGLWYDGSSMTLLDRKRNYYGTVSAPNTVDDLIDDIEDRYGVTLPLSDLLLSDPYASIRDMITNGVSFGSTQVLGVRCQHLGFATPAVDWQLWVEEGARPVPRKVIITYKNEPLAPQFTAIFTKWDLTSRIPDSVFAFVPPEGAKKAEILPLEARPSPEPSGPTSETTPGQDQSPNERSPSQPAPVAEPPARSPHGPSQVPGPTNPQQPTPSPRP